MRSILGQPRAIELLSATLQRDRVHHAFIFHGPRGVGKFTTARAFARILLCLDARPDLTGAVEACGVCASCRLLPGAVDPDPSVGAGAELPAPEAGSAHPDLHIVTKELARFSDDKQVRDRKQFSIAVEVLETHLLEPIARRPNTSGRRVFLVDEAELLRGVGQNKLLKTLEEPPPGAVIILVTAAESQLLPTIRSRCQRVAFGPLPEPVIRDRLDRMASEGDRAWVAELDPKLRDWLVWFAEGSLGRLELAVDYNLVNWADLVLPALRAMHRSRHPADLGEQMAKLVGGFSESWVKAHPQASKDAANKLAAGEMLRLIAQAARSGLHAAAGKAPPGDLVAIEAAASQWTTWLDRIHDAESQLASNVQQGFVFDNLVAQLHLAATRRG